MSTAQLTLEERIAQCSAQTQADIRTLAAVLNALGMQAAQKRFKYLCDIRHWRLWEMTAIADLAKQLAKSQG